MLSRRDLLLGAGAAGAAERVARSASSSPASSEALDEAYRIFARTGFEYHGGLANHGPMAAEALAVLGRAADVIPWTEKYKKRLDDRPSPRKAIDETSWKGALADIARMPDWAALFARQLEEKPWKEVLGVWMPRLAPGIAAGAFHGLLRAGHAVRALAASDTQARRRELADGMAYWAGRYQELPFMKDAPAGKTRPLGVLRAVPFLPAEHKPARGLIGESLGRLERFPDFARAASAVDLSGDSAATLSELTEASARAYLTGAREGIGFFAFLHAITGPSAVRLLFPHVGAPVRELLLKHAFQAVAGLQSAFGRGVPLEGAAPASNESHEDLVARAVANGDEHAIKLTEACLREDAARPSPVYLAAARDGVGRLS